MPRPSNTDQRRTQIAEGLIHVMATSGYDGASVSEIARAAGLTSGLVHYHFKNKQEILLVALQRLVERHDENIAQRLANSRNDPIAQVAGFVDLHLGLGASADPEALACWVLLSGEALRQPEVRSGFEAAIAGIVDRLADVIRRGVDGGLFECDRVDAAASAIVATIQGYFVLAASARDTIPSGSAAESACRMAEGLLRPLRPIWQKGGRS